MCDNDYTRNIHAVPHYEPDNSTYLPVPNKDLSVVLVSHGNQVLLIRREQLHKEMYDYIILTNDG